jgi:hydroxypyruvate isomerase
MVKLAANLSMMFNEVDFLDRFAAAAKTRFRGVEYLFPYDYPVEAIRERLDANGLTQVLFDLPAGDWGAGDRGIACQPDRVGEFQDSVGRALEYVGPLGCERITCLAGIPPEGADPDRVRRTFLDNLRFAAPKVKEAGAKLLIEPINTRDIPGFFLTTTAQAKSIIDDVGSDNVWLQYDIYHMQIMEGDLAMTIEKYADLIPHFQLADNPGRHEPGTGEINYPFLFEFLDRRGYDGWIGCEYRPAGRTEDGLGWAKPYLAR